MLNGLYNIDSFQQVLEFVGTFAFAISGIRLAAAKKFDWFGGYVVGLVTAIGGGTLRDIMLDVTPFWMTNSIYVSCSFLAFLFVVIFWKQLSQLNNAWFIFDTVGLALFTIVGMQKTLVMGYPFWVAIVMGTITGAAGGIMRDVLINEEPLIFRKEIYALACIAGGVVYEITQLVVNNTKWMSILGFMTIFIVRVLAVKYHLCLPLLKDENNK